MQVCQVNLAYENPETRLVTPGPSAALMHWFSCVSLTKMPSKFDIINKCHVGALFHSLVRNLVWGWTSAKTCLKLLCTVCFKQTDYIQINPLLVWKPCVKPLSFGYYWCVYIWKNTPRHSCWKWFPKTHCCRSEKAQREWHWYTSE